VVLLQAVLPLPALTPERAIQFLDYYLQRNRVARKSHEKRDFSITTGNYPVLAS
jgi:hypothetical protein